MWSNTDQLVANIQPLSAKIAGGLLQDIDTVKDDIIHCEINPLNDIHKTWN